MSENKLDQQFMFVKPEFIDHWSYQIDNGKQHLIREPDLYPYVKNFLDGVKEWIKVADIISRHQPFIVFFDSRTCKELHPQEETKDSHREDILRDLTQVGRGLEGKGTKIDSRVHYNPRVSAREDSVDRYLRTTTRNSRDSELPSSITQRRLK